MKGAIYYVAIATVIFSHVKISSFHTKAHLVFHWCLHNKVIYQMDSTTQGLNNSGQINHYPEDKYYKNQLRYPLDSNFSSR